MRKIVRNIAISAGVMATSGMAAWAEAPVITEVRLENGLAHVSLTHPDTGWDHYADVWRIFTPDGQVLAERILLHPHVNEQPFTRSTPVSIPEGVTRIHVVAGCNHGDVSAPYIVDLTKP